MITRGSLKRKSESPKVQNVLRMQAKYIKIFNSCQYFEYSISSEFVCTQPKTFDFYLKSFFICRCAGLRTFALIVYAHPYCARNSCRNAMLRHARTRGARAKEEIYSHEGIVTVALTSLRFNSLGWSVTPTFFWIGDFLY